jgi:hypothetical protein
MVEWFDNLGDTDKIAIVVPIGLAVIGEIIEYFCSKNDAKTI